MEETGMLADNQHLYLRQMLTIRRAEEQVIRFATEHAGLVRGHYHVYIGQEATGVGICSALSAKDYLFTTHRNHGHVIARGGELGPVLAEIIGRSGGYNHGRGGTFHVIAPHLGILHTSGVVGGCMPLAAGAALSLKRLARDGVSVVFFGDGVLEEGVFYETINMAALWQLPVVFVCENNGVSHDQRRTGLLQSSSLSAKRLTDISTAFSIPSLIVDGCDVEAVSAAAAEAVPKVRKGGGPLFIEARITRWPGNAGISPQLIGGEYQLDWAFSPASAPRDVQEWVQHSDPVGRFIRARAVSRDDAAAIDDDVRRAVEEAARFALSSPPPKPESAVEHVFA
jgi:acetoin:2,6-dichlorophenolindophenol oxidoreductase subunit alpha